MTIRYKSATALALLTALFSGLANFLNKIAVTAAADPILYTAVKNGLVALVLIGILVALRKWPEVKTLTGKDWIILIAIGFVGGAVPFALFFTGLTLTTALNAALIHKTLFLWVFILAYPILKERMSRIQWVGVLAIFAADLMIGGFTGFKFNIGELMILVATVLWAVENIIAKKILERVSSEIVAAARMVFGSIFLIIFLAARGGFSLPAMNAAQWLWTFTASALLLGYVLTWYAAVKKAPATYVAVLLIPATLVTNVLTAVFLNHSAKPAEILSAFLFVLGTAFVVFAVTEMKVNGSTERLPGPLPVKSEAGFMDGVLRCSRYAFGPNRLHYCGPDANSEIRSYINEGVSDPGLAHLLSEFKTMYPYLKHIADANGIPNPFDERVVEAYWLGNDLLEAIEKKKFYHHLVEGQQLKKRLDAKDFERLAAKIGQGAVPNHSFHVLDIWKRTGNLEKEHTLYSMDECRVSWGRVLATDGPTVTVLTRPLRYALGKLFLGEPIEKKLSRQLQATYDIEQLKRGDIVSIHWSVPCEVINERQVRELEKYTLRHIALANQTI